MCLSQQTVFIFYKNNKNILTLTYMKKLYLWVLGGLIGGDDDFTEHAHSLWRPMRVGVCECKRWVQTWWQHVRNALLTQINHKRKLFCPVSLYISMLRLSCSPTNEVKGLDLLKSLFWVTTKTIFYTGFKSWNISFSALQFMFPDAKTFSKFRNRR